MCVVSHRDKDGALRNFADRTNPLHEVQRARRQGVLSFGYFSLHKQRKVTRASAKGAKKIFYTYLKKPRLFFPLN